MWKRYLFVLLSCILLIVSGCQNGTQTGNSVTESPAVSATAIPEPTASPLPSVDVTLTAEGKVVDPYTIYSSDSCAHDVLALGQVYSDVIRPAIIGQSVFGKDIYMMKLGNGATKVIMTATTHARENVTTNYLMRCAEELAIAYTKGTSYEGYDIKSLLDKYTVYLCPMNNPDGVDIVNTGADPKEVTNFDDWSKVTWKANGHGVDLNRNFPFLWEEMVADDVTGMYATRGKKSYPGPTAASEPETQALINLCNENDFAFCLNFHTKGKILYWHDSYNGDIPGDARLANLIHDQLGFTVAPSTTAVKNAGGGFENWFRSVFKKPGICIEMTTGGEGDVPYNHPQRGEYVDEVYDIYSEQVLDWTRSKALIPYLLTNYFA